MGRTPEDIAREEIDHKLVQASWHVCDYKEANIHDQCGTVIRNFPLKTGHGTADYLFYIDGKAAGVIEAKKEGTTLTGVEIQSDKYKHGLPDILPAWYRPLPFCYQSTGVETRFTNELDPDPRSRNVFSFHKPETLAEWLKDEQPAALDRAAETPGVYEKPATLRSRVRRMPSLVETVLNKKSPAAAMSVVGAWMVAATATASLALAKWRAREILGE